MGTWVCEARSTEAPAVVCVAGGSLGSRFRSSAEIATRVDDGANSLLV